MIEKQFQVWEDDFLLARKVALRVMHNEGAGTLEERERMSLCIAVQLLRTAQARELILWQATQARSGTADDLIGWLRPDIQQVIANDPDFAANHIALLQSLLLWNTQLVAHIATELYHYIWVIAKNLTPRPFYTADAPVARLIHAHGEPPYYPTATPYSAQVPEHDVLKRLFVGDPDRGALELVFPVAPQCALLMFHPRDFQATLGERQGQVLVLGAESVAIRNAIVALNAQRHIFSASEDFTYARGAREWAAERRQRP